MVQPPLPPGTDDRTDDPADDPADDVPPPATADGGGLTRVLDRVGELLRPQGADGAARAVFAAAGVATVVLVFHAARRQWFFLDEFDFLAGRDLLAPGDLLQPHNEHWTTVPAVVYRLVFQVVGLRAYWPYLVPLVVAHLASATLLRVVMRRAGVGPWIATAGATALLLLGSAREDLTWAFQLTFTGAVALGLGQLVLAGRRGPLGRADAAGVACGLGAVACSGVGLAMVGGVALAALLRGDRRRAALHGGVVVVACGAWQLAVRPQTARGTPSVRQMASFVGWAGADALEGLGSVAVVALVLGGAGVVGAVAAARSLGAARAAARSAPTPRPTAALEPGLAVADVLGLLATALAMAVLAGWTRADIFPVGRGETPGRYLHVVVVGLLPAVALGLTTLGRRLPAPAAATVPALVLVLGVPGNVAALEPASDHQVTNGNATELEVLAQVAADEGWRADTEPSRTRFPGVTAAWLAANHRSGAIPAPSALDHRLQAPAARLALSLQQEDRHPAGPCHRLGPGPTTVAVGDRLTTDGGRLDVTRIQRDDDRTLRAAATVRFVTIWARDGTTIEARRALTLTATTPTAVPVSLCPAR